MYPIGNQTIRELLSPIQPDDFLRTHWQRESLYIPGAPGKFAGLGLSGDWFHTAAMREHRRGDKSSLRAQYYDRHGDDHLFHIDARYLDTLFDAGMTLCMDGIERHIEALKTLTTRFKLAFGLAGDVLVHSYYSPDGGGFALHFDRQEVLILQIEGTKHWRFGARPGLEAPWDNVTAQDKELAEFHADSPWVQLAPPHEDELQQQTLTPGDILYLPAGTWHRARAEGSSLALSLTLVPTNIGHFLRNWLHTTLQQHVAWRRHVPAVWVPDHEPGTYPLDIERYFVDRLADVRRALDALSPEQLMQMWKSQVHRVTESPAPSVDSGAVDRADQFSVHHPIDYAQVVGDDGIPALVLYARGKAIALPAETHPFIHALARVSRFTAHEAMAWSEDPVGYDWSEVQDALTALLHFDVITRKTRAPTDD